MNEGVLSFFAVYQENWPDWGPQIYTAIGVTIKLTIASFALAAALGLLLAIGKMSQLVFVRGPAMGGMIYADDAVRMALWARAERPLDAACSGKTIEVGRGELRSTYCFRVAPR